MVDKVQQLTARTAAGLGQYIQEKRVQNQASVTDLAAYLGEPIEVIHAYESGQAEIPLYNLYAISNFLNIPASEIERRLLRIVR